MSMLLMLFLWLELTTNFYKSFRLCYYFSAAVMKLPNVPKFRIRKPRGLDGPQIGLVLFLGVVGGYYIWNPIIKESTDLAKSAATQNQRNSTK